MIRFSYQVGSFTCIVSRHVFIVTSIDQQYTCITKQKVKQSTFTQASFPSLSDIHRCSGGLKMALSSIDKQSEVCNSLHDWLMIISQLFEFGHGYTYIYLLCMIFGSENNANECHLAVFSVDICSFSPLLCGSPPTLIL